MMMMTLMILLYGSYDRDNKTRDRYRKIGVAACLIGVAAVFALLLFVFYLAPLYHCPRCHYFSCIPITDTYCRSSELRIHTYNDY